MNQVMTADDDTEHAMSASDLESLVRPETWARKFSAIGSQRFVDQADDLHKIAQEIRAIRL